jgi:hypothetical protein
LIEVLGHERVLVASFVVVLVVLAIAHPEVDVARVRLEVGRLHRVGVSLAERVKRVARVVGGRVFIVVSLAFLVVGVVGVVRMGRGASTGLVLSVGEYVQGIVKLAAMLLGGSVGSEGKAGSGEVGDVVCVESVGETAEDTHGCFSVVSDEKKGSVGDGS